MKLLAGELEPGSGRVERGSTVRLAHLSQETTEIPGHLRVLEALEEVRIRATLGDGQEITAGMLCERFGFRGERARTLVRDLSGGERRRLQLMRLLMDEPNVLLLDEPTNDLDIDTLTALEDLLDGWPGTLVIVSHDRYFVERVCDDVHALGAGGAIRHLPGGIDQYLAERRADAERGGRRDAPARGTGDGHAGRDAAGDAKGGPAPRARARAARRARAGAGRRDDRERHRPRAAARAAARARRAARRARGARGRMARGRRVTRALTARYGRGTRRPFQEAVRCMRASRCTTEPMPPASTSCSRRARRTSRPGSRSPAKGSRDSASSSCWSTARAAAASGSRCSTARRTCSAARRSSTGCRSRRRAASGPAWSATRWRGTSSGRRSAHCTAAIAAPSFAVSAPATTCSPRGPRTTNDGVLWIFLARASARSRRAAAARAGSASALWNAVMSRPAATATLSMNASVT